MTNKNPHFSKPKGPPRAQYTDAQKGYVSITYPYCRTPEDRDRLAMMAFVGSRQKLYNLASRIDATRPHSSAETDLASDDGYNAINDWPRLFLRDDPETVTWSKDDDRYLKEHFGNTFIEEISVFLNRSETAVAYRTRQLRLRNVPKVYDFCKIAPWLGLGLNDLYLLTKHGLEVFPCTNSQGEIKIILVSTTSLARVLIRGRLWRKLIDKYDADEFFIKDVLESVVELQNGDALWEPNIWVSHGHTSLNPFGDVSFGWFYNGIDEAMSKAKLDLLDPRDLAPSADVTSDYWRRGENGRDASNEELEAIKKEFTNHPVEI